MKLRNKKTGEIVEAKSWTSATDMFVIFYESKDGQLGSKESFESLAELNEEWEDYEPAEPLIKDEKVRKAVRAWYDAIDYRVDKLLCIKASGSTKLEISDGSPLIYISLFVEKGTLANIKDRTYYTIAELCGEEEE